MSDNVIYLVDQERTLLKEVTQFYCTKDSCTAYFNGEKIGVFPPWMPKVYEAIKAAHLNIDKK